MPLYVIAKVTIALNSLVLQRGDQREAQSLSRLEEPRTFKARARRAAPGVWKKSARAMVRLSTASHDPRSRHLSRNAFAITEAELRLIASAAIIGDKSQPVIG